MIKPQEIKQASTNCRVESSTFRRVIFLLCVVLIVLGALLLAQQLIHRAEGAEQRPAAGQKQSEGPAAAEKKQSEGDPYAWKSMFDGKTLNGWKVPTFGGDGEVKVADGVILLGMGDPMTGITWTGKLPRTDYEVTLQGKRISGSDFFCTTTFPVGDSPCTFVVGGWGGTVVGLSNVDFYDASDNPTTGFVDFKTNQWYRVRIRVTKAKIEAWIDDEQLVDQPIAGHRFSIRDEVDLCRPFGICSWCTEAAVRNIRIRQLKPEEIEAAPPAEQSPKQAQTKGPPAEKQK